MKLGVIFNVFDGEELLEAAVNCIAGYSVFTVLLCQDVSNHGIENKAGSWECERLFLKGKADAVKTFTPDNLLSPSQNELNKRNSGLQELRKAGCTHFLMMDVDEFYSAWKLAGAMAVIEKYDYDTTYCRMFTYYKFPTVQLTPIESYYVPFICRLTDTVQLGGPHVAGTPRVDPTRRVPAGNFRIFDLDDIAMNHMTFVRKDIEKKIRNSSAFKNRIEVNNIIKQHRIFKLGNPGPVLFYERRWQIQYVDDLFNLMPMVSEWP